MIGKTVSHYKIIEKLGEGGMGVVYKAEDTKLRRAVALKFLPRGLDAHEPERARFLQEAQAASALNHPNICAIHTLGEHEGQEFIDMEFVDGTTLRAKIQGGALKIEDAIAYAIQIAAGLEEAHSKGVVHRDIKPENIMVNARNQVKVTDFGLAKLKGSLKLTKTSSTVGTLAYMAPEQIEGREVDARSDIFSFGIVLYEMLAGRRPFLGDQEGAMINSILNDQPEPIERYRSEVSSELSHIVKRALEKDPEDRYQNVHEMLIDLRRAKKETSHVRRAHLAAATTEHRRTALPGQAGPLAEQATPPGAEVARAAKVGGPRRVALLAALVTAATLTLAAILVFTPLLPSKRLPMLNPNPTIRTLDIPFTNIGMPGLSRDGNWIAFPAWDANNEGSLYFMNVSKGAPKRLVTEPCNDLTYADISPDNSEVVYDRPAQGNIWGIYTVSSLGGAGRLVVSPGMSCMWRPDGQRIGYIRGYYRGGDFADVNPSATGKREFWTVKPDGSDNRLEFVDSLSLTGAYFGFAWAPDGKSVAWLRSYPAYSEILIHDLSSGKERQLTSFEKPILDLAWAPNGQVFFSSSKSGNTNIWMIPAKGGEAVSVTKGSGPDLSVRVSADSKRLVVLENREISHLWTADVDGRNARQLTFENQRIGIPTFSPDGKRIAFMVRSDDLLRPGSQIHTMNSDGSNRAQVTAGHGVHNYPSWSADGKYLAYYSRSIGEPLDSSRVYIIEAVNPGTPKLIGRGTGSFWFDSERLCLYERTRNREVLYSIHSPQPLAVGQDSIFEYPIADSKYALVFDSRKASRGAWLKPIGQSAGTPPKQILGPEYYDSAWISASSHFRDMLYLDLNGDLWRMSLPDCRRERLPDLFKNIDPGLRNIQLSSDGKHVVFLKQKSDSRLVLIDNLFK